ncbi:MAG: Hsp33 family molecular chaperone HslO [Roseburia sp.]|nr:Hsp33 family molecular chaperone HslO [Roseburia sp.]
MDKILKTLILGGQVSLAVSETRDLINEAVKIHKPTERAAKILGGLLTCGAYIAAGLKSEKGCVSLTVKAKRGDGAVSVSADASLNVRGYVDGSCENTLVGGTLTVVREDGYSQPFVGTCEIAEDHVSDILETYFGQSEQIPCAAAFSPCFSDGGKCENFTAVIMQLLPDASEWAIEEAAALLEKFKGDGNRTVGAEAVFGKYFKGAADGGITELYPKYRCNCSEEKIRGVLASVGRAELLKICDELGEVKVHCHYCNRDYTYDRKRIEAFIK